MTRLEQTPDSKGKEILTRHEVLELFEITPRTLLNWQQKGILKGAKLGRRVYFSKKEIDALFNQKTISNG